MRRRGGSGSGSGVVVFLCCTLAVPTVAAMMGAYGGQAPTLLEARPALMTGALLGVAHLLLRPLLRLLFAPLGCMTFGAFGLVIDVGLLYACDALVEGFTLPGLPCALLTAVLINAFCAALGGRR